MATMIFLFFKDFFDVAIFKVFIEVVIILPLFYVFFFLFACFFFFFLAKRHCGLLAS